MHNDQNALRSPAMCDEALTADNFSHFSCLYMELPVQYRI